MSQAGVLAARWRSSGSAGWRIDWGAYTDRHAAPPGRLCRPIRSSATRYWVDPPSDAAGRARVTGGAGEPAKRTDAGSWFYAPVWKWALPTGRDRSREEESGTWLVFADTEGPGARLLERLRDEGRVVVEVRAGDSFDRLGEEAFSVRPGHAPDHEALFASLAASGRLPRFIVHAWERDGALREAVG